MNGCIDLKPCVWKRLSHSGLPSPLSSYEEDMNDVEQPVPLGSARDVRNERDEEKREEWGDEEDER